MLDTEKTKAQLIEEVTALRARLEGAESKQTERFLQEWIQRYELVVAASGQIAYEYDVATGRILWGATIENVLGYSMREISGGFEQWMDLLHPDDKEATLAYLAQAEAACSYWDAQYRMRHKDGHYVWIRDRGFFLADSSDRAARQLGMLEDITERKEAEEALAKSREQASLLADLLERSSQPFGVGYPDGHFGTCNAAFLRLLGYTGEELASVNWARDLTPPEWRDAERAKLEELQRTDQSVRYEKEYIRKDGSRIPIELLVHLARDAHGQPKYYYAFVTDISDRKRFENALRTSESFLRSVIEQNPCAIWISDDKGTLLRLNQACRDLLQISDEDVVGKYNIFQDNIVEEAGFMPLVRRVFEEGEAARFELDYDSARLGILSLRQSTAVALDVTIFPIRDATGRIANAVIQHMNITERKRAEEALRESEERFREVVENINEVLWLTDWVDRKLLYVSPSYETVFGRTRESLFKERRSWIEPIHPEDRARVDRVFAEKGERGEYTEEEYRIIQPDGAVRWIRDRSFPIYDIKGFVSRWVGVAEDITERKLAEEALRKAHEELEQRVRDRTAELTTANQRLQEEMKHRELTEAALRDSHDLLRAVMDGINDVIFTKDRQGRYCLVNAAITALTTKRPQEVIGQTSAAIFPPEETRRREEEDRIVIETRTAAHREMTVPVHGQPRNFLLSKMPHFDSRGNVIGIIGIARDITEFKQTQERLRRAERLASIGTLAAGIAHEINNPVGAAFLAAQNALSCLQEGGDKQELVKCLNDILEDAGRCGRIVRNLLRFAKQEPLEKEPAEVAVVLKRAVELVRPLAEERGVTVELAMPSDSPRVLMNVTALLQAIENVIRNGIQASDSGTRVHVELECLEGDVRVVVRDLGYGLTTEQQAHMFEPFYTSRRTEGGSGLGLSIVHGVVADHAGTIHVDSSRGQGTTVTLTIPRCP